MKAPKLLHVLYSGQGGLGSYVMGFVKNDKVHHFEHVAFFYGVAPLFTEYEHFCRDNKIPFTYFRRMNRIDMKGYRAVLTFAREQSVDLIIIHTASMAPAMFWLKRWKFPVFFIDHTNHDFKNPVERLYTMIAYWFADRFIYFIDSQPHALKKRMPWIRITPGRMKKLYKSVDTSHFVPATVLKAPGDAFVIGMAGRMVPGKLQGLIIEAVAQLLQRGCNIKVMLLGEGPLRHFMEMDAESRAVGHAVEFLGVYPSARMPEFYRQLDAYVHATIGETICLSIMEAQAMGLPVLASNVTGVRDVLRDGETALLFENEVPSLVSQLMALYNNPGMLQALREASLAVSSANQQHDEPSEILRMFQALGD